MSGRITLLAVLLAVQLLLIAGIWLSGTPRGGAQEGPYLAFSADAVDQVVIEGDADASVTLIRGDDGWRLADGLPADGGRIAALLGKLAALRAPWPVATSGSAARRFEVSADENQRHVRLLAADDTVADLYLGTSPGYQRVHARRADDDAVYSVALSNFELPAEPGAWLDKGLLGAHGEVTALARQDGWALQHGENGWQLDGAPADQQAAEDMVSRIADLKVTGTAAAPAADAEPRAVFAIEDGEGGYRLSLYGDDQGKDFQVVSDRREGAFALASYVADRLLVDRGTLEPAAQEGAATDGADPAAAAADETPPIPAADGLLNQPAPDDGARAEQGG